MVENIVSKAPLVSVCIITYNSSKYILEALDSVYNQTYHPIELIVSDDGSTDNTVDIIESWLQTKSERFARALVLTVKINTGTTKNCNRGLKAARGKWFKYFAGDDVLLPDAIENYVNFVEDRPEVQWVWAKSIHYFERISNDCVTNNYKSYDKVKSILSKDKIFQYRRLVVQNFLWFPTHFFKTDLIVKIGGFDESFGLYEDYPTWIRFYRNGSQCFFLDKYVLGYRETTTSVVNNSSFMINRNIRKLAFIARKKYGFDTLTWVERMATYVQYALDMFFSIPIMNKRTKVRLFLRQSSVFLVTRLCFTLQSIIKVSSKPITKE